MSVLRKNANQYGDILLFGEGRREREAVGDMKKREEETCMQGAPLDYTNPHRSRAVGTACLPRRLPLSLLKA